MIYTSKQGLLYLKNKYSVAEKNICMYPSSSASHLFLRYVFIVQQTKKSRPSTYLHTQAKSRKAGYLQ